MTPMPIGPPLLARTLACLLLLGAPLLGGAGPAAAAGEPDAPAPAGSYAIQLRLADTPVNLAALPPLPNLSRYRLYEDRRVRDGADAYRLRLGFFPSAAAAAKVQRTLLNAFPGAWVLRVDEAERRASARTAKAVAPMPAGDYAIQLRLGGTPFDPASVRALPVLTGNRLYETRYRKDGTTWYRLRLGFFSSAAEAAKVQGTLQDVFPGAWVLRVDEAERRASANTPVTLPGKTRTTGPAGEAEARLARMMELARQAVANADYPRAIRLYTAVLEDPAGTHAQDAQEFLGLARERNGQLAHAKAEYDAYLEKYPEGPGADRVRQRLAGLLTATQPNPEKLRRPKADPDRARWDAHGGLSQYYRRDTTTDANGDTVVQQSSLDTDYDLSTRRRGPRWDLRTRITGGRREDFLDNGPGNQNRLHTAYVDATDLQSRIATRVGRQSRTTGGVLGRFDGLLVTYPLSRRTRLDAVAGFPVERSTSTDIDTDRRFYGLAFNAGTFAEAWDLQAFFIDQYINGIADRRAVGGELRYFKDARSFLTLVDYDILFAELNKVLVLGNWTLPDESNLNLVVDYGLSPILTTANALQGQLVASVSELLGTYTESEVRSLARDRTPTMRSVTVGASHPLRDDITLAADATVTSTSATPASGGVPETQATGNEYALSTQVIGQGFLFPRDTTIVGVRYSDGQFIDIVSLTADNRYPLGKWRLNPRLRVDYRENQTADTTQWSVLPAFRLHFLAFRHLRFEAEAGGEWSTHRLTADTQNTSGYFVTAGYRFDF